MNIFILVEHQFLAQRMLFRAIQDEEMHTLVVQQLGAKKLCHYVLLKWQMRSSTQQDGDTVADLCKRGLIQLDHSDLGSNLYERPLRQSLALR